MTQAGSNKHQLRLHIVTAPYGLTGVNAHYSDFLNC